MKVKVLFALLVLSGMGFCASFQSAPVQHGSIQSAPVRHASVQSPPVQHASVQSPPVQHIVFVDQSSSPGAEDMPRWAEAAKRKVFDQLRFGDSVIVYAVHDHTAESAPIFEAAVPMLPPGASMEVTLRARKLLRHARVDGPVKLDDALRTPVRSRSTRLIESLLRIPKDPGRVTEVLYLSDMLESTSELDLERTRITSANLVRLAQAAIDRYHLTRGTLDGVTFFCVLDSPHVGSSAPKANNHEALSNFWRLILTSLGGELVAFDSRIQ